MCGNCRVPLTNLIGLKGEKALEEIGFTRQMVSMGHQACGALELWNYPVWLRDVIPQDVHGMDRPDPVDLPALEGILTGFSDQLMYTLTNYKISKFMTSKL